jgi:hypothetical protein
MGHRAVHQRVGLQPLAVARTFVVEAEAAGGVLPDLDQPARAVDPLRRRIGHADQRPGWLVDRLQRVDREQVFQIGEHQLLVLLFVLQAQFDQRQGLVAAGAGDQLGHARVHLGAPPMHAGQVGPGHQAALGARKGLAHAVVEAAKGRVKRRKAGLEALQHKGLEKPGGVRQVPFHRAGIWHGLGLAVLGRQGGGDRLAALADAQVAGGERGAWRLARVHRLSKGGRDREAVQGGHGSTLMEPAPGAAAGHCARRSGGR